MLSVEQMVGMIAESDIDIAAMLELARDKSPAARAQLADTVSALFLDGDRQLSDRERALMTEILRQLIRDVEMTVRKALAERMAARPDAPPELVTTLANDEIEVAHAILTQSPVLQDVELIEIIQHRTMEHQLAIAGRQSVSEQVSDALVETGNENVVTRLLENSGAEISKATMEYLVEQSKRVDAYQNPIISRADLDPALAKRMYYWVSAALRRHILDNFEIDEDELDRNIESTVHEILGGPDDAKMEPDKAAELAKQLAGRGSIDAALLIQTLRQGEVALFMALMEQIAGLRTSIIRRVVFEPGGHALAAICKSAKFAKSDFASIFLLSRKARPGDKVVDPHELSRAMSLYDRIKPETAKHLVAQLSLDPEYLESIITVDKSAARSRKSAQSA